MPRYYCDYCDTHLTHDSPSVRKQHNAGYKHKANVREYYQQFEQLQTQSLIDQKIKEHIGQAGGMFQIGAVYNQHLAAGLPGIMQRPPPRLPILPPPLLPIPGAPPSMMPGFRPPMLPRPGVPGYGMAPPPQMAQIPGQPPMQVNGMMLPRPPPSTMSAAAPTEGGILPPPPGSSTTTSSSAPPPGTNITQPPMYHLHPNGPPPPPASTSTDTYAYASAPGAAH